MSMYVFFLMGSLQIRYEPNTAYWWSFNIDTKSIEMSMSTDNYILILHLIYDHVFSVENTIRCLMYYECKYVRDQNVRQNGIISKYSAQCK